MQVWMPAITCVDPGCSRRGLPLVGSAFQARWWTSSVSCQGDCLRWRDGDTKEGDFELLGLNWPSKIYQSEERTLVLSNGVTKDEIFS